MGTVYDTIIGRLFHFLRDSPYVVGFLDIIADPLQDTTDAMNFILGSTDIDTAEGEQLEKRGELIGVPRPPAQETGIFTLSRWGETNDPDNDHGFYNDVDGTGGYLGTNEGLAAIDGSQMSDVDYLFLIKQKAASYRTKATKLNLFNYLIAFGSRCKIDGTTQLEIEYDPVTYYDLDHWSKNYAVTKGFKPGGVGVYFRENMRNESTI